MKMTTGSRRLQKEYAELLANQAEAGIKDLTLVGDNILTWTALILPNKDSPYANGAFQVDFTFPAEYPFKPPIVMFRTEIYHPNISEKGEICLDLLSNWKPATKAEHVIAAVVDTVNNIRTDSPLRQDLALEYARDEQKFLKKAKEHTKKHAAARSTENNCSCARQSKK